MRTTLRQTAAANERGPAAAGLGERGSLLLERATGLRHLEIAATLRLRQSEDCFGHSGTGKTPVPSFSRNDRRDRCGVGKAPAPSRSHHDWRCRNSETIRNFS
jgi:hypothetical protein